MDSSSVSIGMFESVGFEDLSSDQNSTVSVYENVGFEPQFSSAESNVSAYENVGFNVQPASDVTAEMSTDVIVLILAGWGILEY